MRNTNQITIADLDEELERHDNYQDGIHQLLLYGAEIVLRILRYESLLTAMNK